MKRVRAAAFCLAILISGPAFAALQLASHRAVYELSLVHTQGNIVAAKGRMAIEFRDTCDGWTTAQRMIADMTDSDGVSTRTDFFVTAWESKDGRTMRFDVGDSRDGKADERQRGSATLAASGSGSVELVQGKPAHFALPAATAFPTAQILAILQAAKKGIPSLRQIVFQGGDPSDVNLSTTIVGKPVPTDALGDERAADAQGLLRGVPARSVLVTFFSLKPDAMTPDYEIAAHLFANGVNGSMSFIYRDYTLRATLTKLEPLQPSCASETR